MANKIRVGSWVFRINPDDPRTLQRATIGSNSWSRVTEFNGYEILDLLQQGEDLYVVTERYDYIRRKSGVIEKA